MRYTSRKQLFIILCILVFARTAMAKDTAYPGTPKADVQGTPGRSLDVGTSQLGMWMGYSPDNPKLMGRSTHRPFYELNIQYAHVVTRGESWALKYTFEIIPVAIIKQPPQGEVVHGKHPHPVDLPGSQQTTYGAGVTPIGFQMNFLRGHVLQPYINATVGALYFTEQVPVMGSSKFNFTLGLGAGFDIWYRDNQSIILGYKYHHISNGYTANENAGVDSNLYYVGCAWSWK